MFPIEYISSLRTKICGLFFSFHYQWLFFQFALAVHSHSHTLGFISIWNCSSPKIATLHLSLSDHNFPNFPAYSNTTLHLSSDLTGISNPSTFHSPFPAPVHFPLFPICSGKISTLNETFILHSQCLLSRNWALVRILQRRIDTTVLHSPSSVGLSIFHGNWTMIFHESILYNSIFKPSLFSSNLHSFLYSQLFLDDLSFCFIKEVEPI